VRFLRAIPTDPMTNQKDWGKRCVSTIRFTTGAGRMCSMWYSNSRETGTDGRPYRNGDFEMRAKRQGEKGFT